MQSLRSRKLEAYATQSDPKFKLEAYATQSDPKFKLEQSTRLQSDAATAQLSVAVVESARLTLLGDL